MPDDSTDLVDGRERILTSALELFATRGYGGTTTKAVAERAGVATGLVFYHFESKGHLLRAVLTERSFGPQLRAAVEDLGPDPHDSLAALGRRLLRVAREGSHYMTVLIGSRETAPDLFAAFRNDLDEATDDLAKQLGSHLQLRPARARGAATIFLTTMLSSAALFPAQGSDRTLARTAADVVLRGVSG